MSAAIFILAIALLALTAALVWVLPSRRERLTAAALMGLLADHKDHSDECADDETCPQTVARLAVQLADETMLRLDSTTEGMT